MNLPVKIVVFVLGGGLIGLNTVAYMQARAMTRFTDDGVRTKNLERMSAIETAGVIVFGVKVPRPQNAATPKGFGLPYGTHRFPTSHGPTLEAWHIPGLPDYPLILGVPRLCSQ